VVLLKQRGLKLFTSPDVHYLRGIKLYKNSVISHNYQQKKHNF